MRSACGPVAVLPTAPTRPRSIARHPVVVGVKPIRITRRRVEQRSSVGHRPQITARRPLLRSHRGRVLAGDPVGVGAQPKRVARVDVQDRLRIGLRYEVAAVDIGPGPPERVPPTAAIAPTAATAGPAATIAPTAASTVAPTAATTGPAATIAAATVTPTAAAPTTATPSAAASSSTAAATTAAATATSVAASSGVAAPTAAVATTSPRTATAAATVSAAASATSTGRVPDGRSARVVQGFDVIPPDRHRQTLKNGIVKRLDILEDQVVQRLRIDQSVVQILKIESSIGQSVDIDAATDVRAIQPFRVAKSLLDRFDDPHQEGCLRGQEVVANQTGGDPAKHHRDHGRHDPNDPLHPCHHLRPSARPRPPSREVRTIVSPRLERPVLFHA